MIEERGEEHRRPVPADAGFEHHLERMTRIPAVDEVDVRTDVYRPEHGADHPGRGVTGDPMRLVLPGVIQPFMWRSC